MHVLFLFGWNVILRLWNGGSKHKDKTIRHDYLFNSIPLFDLIENRVEK